jgi:hypothetical protein
MLICNRCGSTINESELKTVVEEHGERHLDLNCCYCRGKYINATKCKVCGKWFDNTDLRGICYCCLEEYETVGMALEIGDANREDVPINSFITSILDEDKINKILEKYVEEHYTDGCREVNDFLYGDISCFTEWVEEKEGV